MESQKIHLKKVEVHNLKGVDLSLNHGELIVFTGVSGSGKSSLAFDTIYVEGGRRYIESLSNYARRYLGQLPKPEAELISGLSPTIAIEQKSVGRSPRSTVGTITGIYDYLRVIYARIGIAHCPVSGEAVKPQSDIQIVEEISSFPKGSKLIILAPYALGKKGEFKDDFAELLRRGFMRVRLDGQIIDLSEPIAVDGSVAHDVDYVVDRLVLDETDRVSDSVARALELGDGVMSVLDVSSDRERLFSRHAYSKESGLSYPPLEPHDFSFNHPQGMCPACEGIGTSLEFDLDRVIDPEMSIAEGACLVASSYDTVKWGNIYDNIAKEYKFSLFKPWKTLSDKAKHAFLYGNKKKWMKMRFVHPKTGKEWVDYVRWRGVLSEAKRRYQEATSDAYQKKMGELMKEMTCSACDGSRIKPYPAATTLGGKTISELTAMTIEEARDFCEKLVLGKQEKKIAGELLQEVRRRLGFLFDVGLHYLMLERTSPTLSGGEAQRVRLASHIGVGLVGTTYILDEPSIGLHHRDNAKLIETLERLRDSGNTVIVVEHDEETIYAADTVVDVGPGAGVEGGEIIAIGSPKEIMAAKRSVTGDYLSRRKEIAIPKKRRTGKHTLSITGASHHNLQNVSVDIPLETFVAVTGVSGSGKSSLISDTLYPALANALHRAEHVVGKHDGIVGLDHIDKVIAIDQTPIGRTPRSNPSTYVKLLDAIRDLFAALPQAQARGYKPGRFSFNVLEGSCPHCRGMGAVRVDMDFLEDIFVTCPECRGKRFDAHTLSITYKGKTIHDVLEMSIREAREFFSAIPSISHSLEVLARVGLEYMTLGQSSTTLSGGEAQRIKLAKELIRPSTGKTLYILDEPTTGLHFHDIAKLIDILQHLIDEGNTVLVIEHNTDMIKVADHIIDLGPEGGRGGGRIIATGTPEEIATRDTPTGRAIQEALSPKKHAQKKKRLGKKGIDTIEVTHCTQNNLRGISCSIPRNAITVCTGPSGSGKSSLAFETVYAEGQRRYTESLSPYARQFIKQMPRPRVEEVTGLSPAIAIEQKHHAGNPRSTVGTITEAYDYLRLMYAHMGIAYCPETGEKITSITPESVVTQLMALPEKTKIHILAPIDSLEELKGSGFQRVRLNGTYYRLDEEISLESKRRNELLLVIDRLAIKDGIEARLFEAIEQARRITSKPFLVDIDGTDRLFNLAFAVKSTGKTYPPITPHTFSFNAEEGMCLDCLGLGFQWGCNIAAHKEVMRLKPLDLMEKLWKEEWTGFAEEAFIAFAKSIGINLEFPLHLLSLDNLHLLLNGSSKSFSFSGLSLCWPGINTTLARIGKSAQTKIKQTLTPFLETHICPTCNGSRLNPLARHVRIEETSIAEVCTMPIADALHFVRSLSVPKVLEESYAQLVRRLSFLVDIGIDYLSLSRSAPTLSGGEAQRIHLARQLGSNLTGCLYVLDEPTIGLHPYNSDRLNRALIQLRDSGNTLLLVEHDPLTIQIADHLIDFGPEAGSRGGHIVAQGPISLYKPIKVSRPKKRRTPKEAFTITHATVNNLKDLSLSIPVGLFTCITGVSGSGKSTLAFEVVQKGVSQALAARSDTAVIGEASLEGVSHFSKMIVLDQNPIGHTIRADISTYSDLNAPLRRFFAELPGAKTRGLLPKHFSHNHLKGMCRSCWGLGHKSIRLQFLPPVKVTCEACRGLRLNPLSLEVAYNGKNFGHILSLTVEEAKEFLPPIPKLTAIIDVLIRVGLGYLSLGQAVATLSGGEAQRLRLATELAKRTRGRTLYLFDEPTIGLHPSDIERLLPIFHELVERGHTLIIIEHNIDIIENADHIIDLGPGPGSQGGFIVAQGPPEAIAAHAESYTGKYLTRISHTHGKDGRSPFGQIFDVAKN